MVQAGFNPRGTEEALESMLGDEGKTIREAPPVTKPKAVAVFPEFDALITSFHNKCIQTIVCGTDQKDLMLALKGCGEEARMLILNNMSKRMAAMIVEEMEFTDPIKKTDCQAAQQKITNLINRLSEAGEIFFLNKDDYIY
jgi:flagellar motor switch protein FliG